MQIKIQTTNETFLAKRWQRFALVITLFAIGVILFLILNVALGSINIPLTETVKILFRAQGTDAAAQSIIWQIRLPRALGALLSGAALAGLRP